MNVLTMLFSNSWGSNLRNLLWRARQPDVTDDRIGINSDILSANEDWHTYFS